MLRQLFFSFFLCLQAIACYGVDFDVIVVGSSPICLLEALYEHHLGNRVLILEESGDCGGAWKSGKICGISNADITCHEIGRNLNVLRFLEDYVGCTAVSMEPPNLPYDSKKTNQTYGYYFSQGCYELVNNLLKQITANKIPLLLNHSLESISIEKNYVTAKLKEHLFTTSKLLVPRHCSFVVESSPAKLKKQPKQLYYHIYLLIADRSLPRFSYKYGHGQEIVRAMNLSPFVGLVGTGKHLIIAQTNKELFVSDGQKYLDILKQLEFVHPSASLLKVEVGTYEQARMDNFLLQQAKTTPNLIQTLETSSLEGMNQYIEKWKKTIPRIK